MVRVPTEFSLDIDEMESLLKTLEGDDEQKSEWISKCKKWIFKRKVQFKLYNLTLDWLKKYGKTVCWDDLLGDTFGTSPEEALEDRVRYEMSYLPVEWSIVENKVVLNKYSNQPMLKKEVVEQLLQYLNECDLWK